MKLSPAFLVCLLFFALGCSQLQPEAASPILVSVKSQSTVLETVTPTASQTSTTAPVQTPVLFPLRDLYQFNTKFITDPELAIAYSHNLLILRGYEKGFSYDNALYTPVEFPDGAKGAFVALGFSGIARGYKLLYQIEKPNTFRLIQLEASDYDWGVDFGDKTGFTWTKVPLKFPELLHDASGKTETLIELSGSSHWGTGLWDNGYFEIIRITNYGGKVIYSGSRFTGNMPSYSEFKYQFVDLDSDGNKEIIKEGQDCKVDDLASFDPATCLPIRKIYKYDGEVYTEQP